MSKTTKPCVFCGKVNDFLMACEGVCLRCHDKLQADHGLYVGTLVGDDNIRDRAQKMLGTKHLGKSYLEGALDEVESLRAELAAAAPAMRLWGIVESKVCGGTKDREGEFYCQHSYPWNCEDCPHGPHAQEHAPSAPPLRPSPPRRRSEMGIYGDVTETARENARLRAELAAEREARLLERHHIIEVLKDSARCYYDQENELADLRAELAAERERVVNQAIDFCRRRANDFSEKHQYMAAAAFDTVADELKRAALRPAAAAKPAEKEEKP